MRVAPQLIAAPDAPVPFAPELESQFRPCREQILAAIGRITEDADRPDFATQRSEARLSGMGVVPGAFCHGGT